MWRGLFFLYMKEKRLQLETRTITENQRKVFDNASDSIMITSSLHWFAIEEGLLLIVQSK